ncbi:1-aminocyclopropane-1-carboxylate synthase [Xylariales sp. AK1849]|nr:1-aminocyclopropane-1-carboxylate synthase [Xylariales sp. AK1849]
MSTSTEWLSERVRAKVEAVLPQITTSLTARDNRSNIDLAIAENTLLRDEVVLICKEIINKRLEPKVLSYPGGFGGEPRLLRALADFFNQYFQPAVPVDFSHVVAGPGATSCLASLLSSICDPGDAIIVPGSYWSNIPPSLWIVRFEANPILSDGFDIHFSLQPGVSVVNTDTGHDIEADFEGDLQHCFQEACDAASNQGRTVRAVVLTNPHNPTGLCYSRRALESAAQFCEARDLHLITDEVFALSQIQPDTERPFVSALALNMPSLGVNPARVHTVWSTSKDFNSSGYRLGCVVSQANAAVRASIGLMTTTQISSLTALVTTGLLEHSDLSRLIKLNSRRLRMSYNQMTMWLDHHGFPFIPATAGLCVLARLAPHATTWEQERLVVDRLKSSGVLVSTGSMFHLKESQKGWYRIVIAVNLDVLAEALRRMEKALGLCGTIDTPDDSFR